MMRLCHTSISVYYVQSMASVVTIDLIIAHSSNEKKQQLASKQTNKQKRNVICGVKGENGMCEIEASTAKLLRKRIKLYYVL